MSSARRAPLAFVVAIACTSGGGAVVPPGDAARSGLARVTTAADPADLAAVVRGDTDFGFDLYRTLVDGPAQGANLAFSPLSVTFALAMTYAGAAGETRSAFERTLHVDLPEARYHRGLNDLDRQLASRAEAPTAGDARPFRLELTNQLFAQQGFAFEQPFLDVLAQEYGSDVRLLDFQRTPEAARQLVNAWVEGRTERRILELLPRGFVTEATRAVLVNAVYFLADWATRFDARDTRPASFTLLDGSVIQVPTMLHPDLPARAGVVDGVEVVQLPYVGGQLSMLLLAPPPGTLAALERQLTAARLGELVGGLRPERLTLSVPKFEVRTSADLQPLLTQLGLGLAFSDAADLSRMSRADRLALSGAVHQAFVKVDERGTEAAAATAVGVGVVSAPVTRRVAIDRPFLFLVRDDATGAVAFLGRVLRP